MVVAAIITRIVSFHIDPRATIVVSSAVIAVDSKHPIIVKLVLLELEYSVVILLHQSSS